MKLDFKTWNVMELGRMIVLGIILIVVVAIFHVVVSPVLVAVLPSVFTAPLSVTDILLFMILIRTFVDKA